VFFYGDTTDGLLTNTKLVSYSRDALTNLVDDRRRTKREERCSTTPDLINDQEATNGHPRTYRHRYLRAEHSIRLLRFLPDSDERVIRCTIKEYDITSETILYVALSYVWGDATIRHPIFLDGEIAYITSNLREALAHLGNASPHASFWIDAICIDQNNTAERMHQVGKMRAIYSNAAEVVVWLGPGHVGIERLSSVVHVHRHNCLQWWLDEEPVCRCGSLIDRDVVAAIQHLIRQPYWHRVWVIQEVVMAEKIRIMCGAMTLNWSYFGRFLMEMSDDRVPITKELAFDPIDIKDRSSFIRLLSDWPWGSSTLAHALNWSASRLATDGRDKVYAVLGLVDKGAGRLLAADYTLSPCNVYRLAIRAMAADCEEERCRCGLPVGMISDVCSHDALERDRVSADGRVRRCSKKSKSFLLTVFQISAKDGTSVDTGCDGIQCHTQAKMQRFAEKHRFVPYHPPRELLRHRRGTPLPAFNTRYLS